MTAYVALPNQTTPELEKRLLPFILSELDIAQRFPAFSPIIKDWVDGLPSAEEPSLISRCIGGAREILEAFAKVLSRPENAPYPLHSLIPASSILWDPSGDFAAPLKQTGRAHVQQTLRPLLTALKGRASHSKPLILG